jgi:hypothetical protein
MDRAVDPAIHAAKHKFFLLGQFGSQNDCAIQDLYGKNRRMFLRASCEGFVTFLAKEGAKVYK